MSVGFVDLPSFREAARKLEVVQLSPTSHTDPNLLRCFQEAFDVRLLEANHPRLRVEHVVELQNWDAQARYLLRRAFLMKQCGVHSNLTRVHVASHEIHWASALGLHREPTNPLYNEFYLFYSTSPDSVGDCLGLELDAGSDRVYLAENAARAQELTVRLGGIQSTDTEARSAVVACRVFCGRVCDLGRCECTETTPVPTELQKASHSPTSDDFHSTMWTALISGENAQSRGAKEFLLPSDQVLPEFVVFCREERRLHSMTPLAARGRLA